MRLHVELLQLGDGILRRFRPIPDRRMLDWDHGAVELRLRNEPEVDDHRRLA